MALSWKLVDETLQYPPSNLDLDEDVCYYAREYVTGGGYKLGDNQLITNLKKSPNKKGTFEWTHKQNAVRQFAHELPFKKPATIAFIPTSKTPDDPRYDPRIVMLTEVLNRSKPHLTVEAPIEIISSKESTSSQSGIRKVEDYLSNYRWVGFKKQPATRMFVIDDVLTSGAHFKAYKIFVNQHCPGLEVVGLFWCITRQPTVQEIFGDISPDAF